METCTLPDIATLETWLKGFYRHEWAKGRTLIMPKPEGPKGCYRWVGTFNAGHSPDGADDYPIVSFGKKRQMAIRFIAVHYGILESFDDPRQIHHTCLHAWCVNPAHFEALTKGDHVRLHWQLRKERIRNA